MTRTRPIDCPHCGFTNWENKFVCERCKKGFDQPIKNDGYETVVINGKHVKRKLKNET